MGGGIPPTPGEHGAMILFAMWFVLTIAYVLYLVVE